MHVVSSSYIALGYSYRFASWLAIDVLNTVVVNDVCKRGIGLQVSILALFVIQSLSWSQCSSYRMCCTDSVELCV